MAVNTNSETSGIPVRFSFNQHPPGIGRTQQG